MAKFQMYNVPEPPRMKTIVDHRAAFDYMSIWWLLTVVM